MTASRPMPVFDGHNDALLRLYRREAGVADAPAAFLNGEGKGHVDLPMARQGGFAGGMFAIFVPSTEKRKPDAANKPDENGPGDILQTYALEQAPALAATVGMASLLLRIERESEGRVKICRSVADIEHCVANGILATVLHIEGVEAIDEKFEFLDVIYQAGLRSLGPVWSRSNAFGHGVPFLFPSSPDTGPGLTDLGKELVRRCNRLRILLDLSHLNEKGFWDVAALSDAPLVATHSNAHAICPHSRNLTDQQLAAIRKSEGMVGVNFAVNFLRPDGKRDDTMPLEQIVDHLDHLIQHLGEDGVGLGSDFDGATMPAKIGTAAGLPRLIDAMRARGYGEALVEKLCFRNWLRVLKLTWGG